MRFLPLLWSNLKRKKLRTVLTVLSILVAFILYGFLCAIKQALTGGVSLAGADRLVVRHKISIIMSLPESYTQRISRIPGVAAVSHQTWFGGIYQDPKNFFAMMPVEPEPFLKMFPEFILPEDQKEAWLRTRTGIIVGRATAERFKWEVGDRIPIQSPIWQRAGAGAAWEFDIVGIFEGSKKGTDTTSAYFRYDYFDEARAFNKGQVGWYTVRIGDPDRAAEIAAAIDEEFANSPAETKTEPEGAFAQAFAQQVGNIGAILVGILSAVFFTILLVAGNTMAQAVRERTEELGVLKAIGFSNQRVLFLVLGESCIMAAVGGLVGLGLAWLVTLGGSPVPSLLPIFYLRPLDIGIGIALVVGLGAVAGIAPALQAMSLRIADALRRAA
jgi:putative ABC transport system permease protein